ncbi:MAG: hypothetical protein HY805_07455, partial [Nitrospirae bacterium]|nr:hypothetical protein [Nitrospirota bacterium]
MKGDKGLKSAKKIFIFSVFFFFFLVFHGIAFSEPSCDLAISGPDGVTKSGSYQYSIANANGDIMWCVEGSGVSINASGVVSLSSSACGAFSVSATDSCGEVKKDVRITNAGKWQAIESCFCEPCQYGSGRSTNICYSGRFKYEATHQIKVYGTMQQCLEQTANKCNPFCSSPCHPGGNSCYSCVWLGYPRVCFDCIYTAGIYEWICPTQKESVKVCAGGCEEGETRACYTGPAGTAGVG